MENQDAPSQSSHSGRQPRTFPARRMHTFVLRLVVDGYGDLHGLVSEPGADDAWRPGFASLEQLLGILGRRLQVELSDKQIEENDRGNS